MALILTDVNVGSAANDGTGDPARTAFQAINANNALIAAAVDLNTAKVSMDWSTEVDANIVPVTSGLYNLGADGKRFASTFAFNSYNTSAVYVGSNVSASSALTNVALSGNREADFSVTLAALTGDAATFDLNITGHAGYASAATNLTGGAVSVSGGAGASGAAGNAHGGDVNIDGGRAYGTGTDGNIVIGANYGTVDLRTSITSPAQVILDGATGLAVKVGATNAYLANSTGLYPAVDSTYSLGLNAVRWTTVYSDNLSVNGYTYFSDTYSVAGLPSATVSRALACVSDATSPVNGETVTGGGSTEALVFSDGTNWKVVAGGARRECISIAISDETTALTTGTAKATFRMPYAFTLTELRATVTTAPTGSTIIVDINEGGTSIMTTNKLSIDATEKTSTTAATAPGITDASLADDAEITIDLDQVGSSTAGAGAKIHFIGYRT